MCVHNPVFLCALMLACHLVLWLLRLKNLAASPMRAAHPIRGRAGERGSEVGVGNKAE